MGKSPIEVGKTLPELTEAASYGYYYLLIDVQIKTLARQYYRHYAYAVTSEVGVQNNSQIYIDYNPAYETLQLHNIKVFRNGRVIDYAKKVDIKDLNRGGNVSGYVYEETRTAYIVLDDIRPNDVIEYDYTITGENPVFNGRFSFTFPHDFSFYVDRLHVCLLKPQTLALDVNYCGKQLDYTVAHNGDDEVSVTEKYRFPHFWKNNDSSFVTSVALFAHQISTKTQGYTLKNVRRTAPLYLEYPLNIDCRISLQSPGPWTVEKQDVAVENDYFSFTKKIQYAGMHIIAASQNDATTGIEVVRRILGSAIWIAYFAMSERCKRTFVR